MSLEDDPASRQPWAFPVGRVAFAPSTAPMKDPLAHALAVAAAPERQAPRLVLLEPDPPDPLRDALSHIAKTAAASRTQSRRCRWIQQRAEGALAGIPYKAGDFDMPKISSNSPERLMHKNRHLRVELAKLKEAAKELLRQIEIGTFVDEEGHRAQMLKPAIDLAALLATAGDGLAADPPEIELLEWTSAEKKPDADISYLLEVRHQDGSTECLYGWWDDELEAWHEDVDGDRIAGMVLRYSDPKGLGA